jgi:hypothetical protein
MEGARALISARADPILRSSIQSSGGVPVCRNIRPLFNFDPPATDAEIRAASVQFVRKLSGFSRPSAANAAAFERAIDEVARASRRLVASLTTAAPPKDREAEAAKARERSRDRFTQVG